MIPAACIQAQEVGASYASPPQSVTTHLARILQQSRTSVAAVRQRSPTYCSQQHQKVARSPGAFRAVEPSTLRAFVLMPRYRVNQKTFLKPTVHLSRYLQEVGTKLEYGGIPGLAL